MRRERGISSKEGEEEEEPELRLNLRTNTKDVRRHKRKSCSGASKLRSHCSHVVVVVVEKRPSFADYTFAMIQAIEDDDADEERVEKSWNDMAEILTWQAWRDDRRDRRRTDG